MKKRIEEKELELTRCSKCAGPPVMVQWMHSSGLIFQYYCQWCRWRTGEFDSLPDAVKRWNSGKLFEP